MTRFTIIFIFIVSFFTGNYFMLLVVPIMWFIYKDEGKAKKRKNRRISPHYHV